jgi:hypothetical protein
VEVDARDLGKGEGRNIAGGLERKFEKDSNIL